MTSSAVENPACTVQVCHFAHFCGPTQELWGPRFIEPLKSLVFTPLTWLFCIGKTVPKIIINGTIKLFLNCNQHFGNFKPHNSFRVLFDKIALCQLYRHTFVPCCYPASNRVAYMYCDEYVCVSVCLFASISPKPHVQSLQFLCMLPMAVARSFSGGVVIRRGVARECGGAGRTGRHLLGAANFWAKIVFKNSRENSDCNFVFVCVQ